MFDWVGGRTSEMSAVGLLPAALQGINVQEMLAGAALMDGETRIPVNFDDVLVPADHTRSYNDTCYVDPQTVLRCHTSAHQAELLRSGHTHFLVTGVWRCLS